MPLTAKHFPEQRSGKENLRIYKSTNLLITNKIEDNGTMTAWLLPD